MDKKVLFNETLTSLVEYAASQGNSITSEDVKLYFKGQIEDDSEYRLIYDYLYLNKIKVDGRMKDISRSIYHDGSDSSDTFPDNESAKPHDETVKFSQDEKQKESKEELDFIKMYMSEMENITPISDSEKKRLADRLIQGDTSVVNAITESYLKTVAQISETYRGKGVTFGDLIQEGNMALFLAVSDYNFQTGDLDSFIKRRVTAALDEAVNMQLNSDRIGQHLADKLNRLDAVTKDLSKKLGRTPEIKDISQVMGISEDEVSQLLKASLDTLSVENESMSEEMPDTKEVSDNVVAEKDPLEWRINKRNNKK